VGGVVSEVLPDDFLRLAVRWASLRRRERSPPQWPAPSL
jgi:hypothetical protein